MKSKEQLELLQGSYEYFLRQEDFDTNKAVQWALQSYTQKEFFDMNVLKEFLDKIVS